VLAVVILAVGFVAPALLPSTTGPDTLKALQDAELARRQLHGYDASLPLVETRSDVERLKEADFDQLVEQAQEEFEALRSQFAERVNQAKRVDRDHKMPESGLRALAVGPAGVRSSVSSFEKLLRENQRVLAEAVKNSRAASQTDRDALGVGEVAGAVKLVEAGRLLDEARQLRAELTAVQARAFAAASRWAAVRAERDYSAGLDVTAIRSGLDTDSQEIEVALTEARQESDRLANAVAQRQQELANVRAQLEEARRERLSLEQTGFTVGDDASFEAYRGRYLELSERLRMLQQQEQKLAFGGIEGLGAADDLPEGELEGDEVYGLDELQRRLAIAEDRLARYTGARKALKAQAGMVDTVGEQAQVRVGEYAARLETLAASVNELRDSMAQLAQQASEKEAAALGAAREAATAFGQAKSAVDRWTREANALQREKDAQRINERLKLITGDSFAAGFASNAEAQAKMLVGRIHTERALGLAAELDTLSRIKELVPGWEFEAGPLQDAFNTARDEAVSILNEAREVYQRLTQKETSTSWVHQASLATVYHLLWQIDEFNTEQHRSKLIDELGRVLAGRQQSPHLQEQVKLYASLTGGELPTGTEPEAEEPADEEPAADAEGE
jgi:hypothetical protein